MLCTSRHDSSNTKNPCSARLKSATANHHLIASLSPMASATEAAAAAVAKVGTCFAREFANGDILYCKKTTCTDQLRRLRFIGGGDATRHDLPW
jgi:hypothetical protein